MNHYKVLQIADVITDSDRLAARLILNTAYNKKHRFLFISESKKLCVKHIPISLQAEVGKAYESIFLDIKNILGTLSDLQANTTIEICRQ